MNGAAVLLPAEYVPTVRNHTMVDIFESDVPRWLMDESGTHSPSEQVTPWGIHRVQAFQVPDVSNNSITTCIIDSGYDGAHEDLWHDSRVSGETPWNTDGCRHGTHVAGTVSAINNNIGVVGVGNSLPLYIVKVFGDDCAWTYASDVIAAAQQCQSQGAKVISMSLGCSNRFPSLCKSQAEETGFQTLYDDGVLSIAAAGNAGNTYFSYPASYPSVVSVAASASDDTIASFSQRNNQVELAAPGVAVESTVPMGTGQRDSVTVNNKAYSTLSMDGSALGSVSGTIVDCGLASTPCTGAQGGICLIQRGTNTFVEKADNCAAGGGLGALIYNNVNGDFAGSVDGMADPNLLVFSMSMADGQEISKLTSPQGSISAVVANYGYLDGTSMATPHVSGLPYNTDNIAITLCAFMPTARVSAYESVRSQRVELVMYAYEPMCIYY